MRKTGLNSSMYKKYSVFIYTKLSVSQWNYRTYKKVIETLDCISSMVSGTREVSFSLPVIYASQAAAGAVFESMCNSLRKKQTNWNTGELSAFFPKK